MRAAWCWLLIAGVVFAEETPKVSSFAPAEDLLREWDVYVGRAGESLADKAKFNSVKVSRLEKDSATLAVLALTLGMSDEEHKLKQAAPALLTAAQTLETGHEDFDKATAAFNQLKQATSDSSAPAEPLAWKQVATMVSLMKQVPIIHSPLKRGVTEERRFAREAEKTAAAAATLAAIAQVALHDEDYAGEDQAAEWRKLSAAMRNAAGELNAAIRAKDQPRAATALDKLNISCDDCHRVFRQ